jgi:Serine dehydrogenase proteinase
MTTSEDNSTTADPSAPAGSNEHQNSTTASASVAPQTTWYHFIRNATPKQIEDRYVEEVKKISTEEANATSGYKTLLALLSDDDSITKFQLDQLYAALSEEKPHSRNVLLILLSSGGQIEPAYQISKICKLYSKDKFVAAIPRHAKSAATLIALGADEIHMGPLGQLGPIDPQISGLPALGVSQALQTIADLSQTYPGSAEMFARYLRTALTVYQIGYCDRVSASAVQYAERLLATKPALAPKAAQMANKLVYEYKDHGFVIDLDEAQRNLGSSWIRTETPELKFAEKNIQALRPRQYHP